MSCALCYQLICSVDPGLRILDQLGEQEGKGALAHDLRSSDARHDHARSRRSRRCSQLTSFRFRSSEPKVLRVLIWQAVAACASRLVAGRERRRLHPILGVELNMN
jgi:hypothetical protein